LPQLADTLVASLGAPLLACRIACTPWGSTQLREKCVRGRERLGVPAGAAAVVTNGRVVVLHDAARGHADGASAEDLGLLQMVAESSQLSNQVHGPATL